MGKRTSETASRQQGRSVLQVCPLWVLPQWLLSIGSRCTRWQEAAAQRIFERISRAIKFPPPDDHELREIIEYLDELNGRRARAAAHD